MKRQFVLTTLTLALQSQAVAQENRSLPAAMPILTIGPVVISGVMGEGRKPVLTITTSNNGINGASRRITFKGSLRKGGIGGKVMLKLKF